MAVTPAIREYACDRVQAGSRAVSPANNRPSTGIGGGVELHVICWGEERDGVVGFGFTGVRGGESIGCSAALVYAHSTCSAARNEDGREPHNRVVSGGLHDGDGGRVCPSDRVEGGVGVLGAEGGEEQREQYPCPNQSGDGVHAV